MLAQDKIVAVEVLEAPSRPGLLVWAQPASTQGGRLPRSGMRYEEDVKVGSSHGTQIWYDPYQAREFRFLIKADFVCLIS